MQIFNESDLQSEGRILVKFGAPWCGPCNSMIPILEDLAEDEYPIFDVNTDNDPDSATKYQIRSVPTFIVFENGRELRRAVGAQSKQQLIKLLED